MRLQHSASDTIENLMLGENTSYSYFILMRIYYTTDRNHYVDILDLAKCLEQLFGEKKHDVIRGFINIFKPVSFSLVYS